MTRKHKAILIHHVVIPEEIGGGALGVPDRLSDGQHHGRRVAAPPLRPIYLIPIPESAETRILRLVTWEMRA